MLIFAIVTVCAYVPPLLVKELRAGTISRLLHKGLKYHIIKGKINRKGHELMKILSNLQMKKRSNRKLAVPHTCL